ncbi:MAG: catechol 2,3-dioxygenase, partial [Armatimonadota bacterium]|nr:catechol 2,3-dioxygenase [Armatimonadota bacterium]
MGEPLVVQLAHVEITSPKPDQTLWFFHDLLGLEETTRQGQSVYLRA